MKSSSNIVMESAASQRFRLAMLFGWLWFLAVVIAPVRPAWAEEPALNQQAETASVRKFFQQHCIDCHDAETNEGGLDLTAIKADFARRDPFQRWVKIHDRVADGEMPPDADDLNTEERRQFTRDLSSLLHVADARQVAEDGRGPMRRLNRDEYQQNLRDVLALPSLDIRDILPEDRESHGFNKTADALDISRVQLTAYLDAAEVALRSAIVSGLEPPTMIRYRVVGRKLFAEKTTFGERQAMFFAKDSKAIDNKQLDAAPDDEAIELALFRSAHWPYYGYPQGFVVRLAGEYRVRFSARAVVQLPGFELQPAVLPVPMTFRARKPSGADVSGDVRATGGLIDIAPERADFETTLQLREGETFEYSLLGLPVPLARNVDGGPPTYRYPPFPERGQPGVAFQWLEVEGPVSPPSWPPASHRVLFDVLPLRAPRDDSGLPVEVVSENPAEDARRLLRRFVERAARQPIPDDALQTFERLIFNRLKQGASFAEAMLAGYKAFLCSGHMLFLYEPRAQDPHAVGGANDDIHYAIASRLSHFLTNTPPCRATPDLGAAGAAARCRHASLGDGSADRRRGIRTLRQQLHRLLVEPQARSSR